MQQNISKSTALPRENHLPQVIIASLCPGMGLFSFPLLQFQGEGEERIAMATMFRKMLSKHAFSVRVLSMILAGCGLMANVSRPMFWGLFGLKKIKVRFTVQVG